MCEEEEAASEPSPQREGRTTKERTHDDSGAITALSDSLLLHRNERPAPSTSCLQKEPAHQEELAGYVPLQVAPLRPMPVLGAWTQQQTPAAFCTMSREDFNRGLNALAEKTSDNYRLVGLLESYQSENDRLTFLLESYKEKESRESECESCALLRQELNSAHKKIAALEAQLKDIVYAGGDEGRRTLPCQLGWVPQHRLREFPPLPAPEAQQAPEDAEGSIDIWTEDADREFQRMKQLLGDENSKWYIAVDTEFCRKDGVVDPWGEPPSPDAHYQQTRRIVDEGDLAQVGFALADLELVPDSINVFQFNIEFDSTTRSPTSENVKFLSDIANLKLEDHASRGIALGNFINHLTSLGIFGNSNITWITFQGYSDFGYLLRAIEEAPVLTPDRREFLRLVRRYFPNSYDLKVLHRLGIRCKKSDPHVRGSGSLNALAESLRVSRIGQEHGSGSDAHLTLGCFCEMILSDQSAAFELQCYKNILYGVANPLPIPASPSDNTDADQIHVWVRNFENQLKIISGSFDVHSVLSVQVSFSDPTINCLNSYAEARMEASLSGSVDLALAISDHSGRLAFGRVWIFHVQGAGHEEGGRISPAMLADMLTSTGSLHNPKVIWLSSRSASFLYLVSILTTTRCLPLERQGFLSLCNSFFPSFRVIELSSLEEDPGRRALITLRHLLAIWVACPTLRDIGWHSTSDLMD